MDPFLVLRALGALALSATTACIALDFDGPGLDGSGRITSETRSLPRFERVTVEDAFEVEVTVGPATSVAVTGDDNLLPHVRTEVRNETLHIETARDLDPTDEIRLQVSTPFLRGLSSSGSSDVRATGVRTEAFATSVSGSSDLVADGDFGDVEASISGSGTIRLSGTGETIDASVSGSGELDLAKLVARAGEVRVSGSGDVVVHVAESLAASVSGSGDVRYLGDPQVRSSVSGSGSVRPASSGRSGG